MAPKGNASQKMLPPIEERENLAYIKIHEVIHGKFMEIHVFKINTNYHKFPTNFFMNFLYH